MKITILKRTEKSFEGNNGEDVQYAWYKARRHSDQVNFQFGSVDTSHEEGEDYDLNIEKREGQTGKISYHEVI